MTDLVIHQPASTAEKIEWSRAMAPATLLPKQYQGQPANLLFAVEYADALGIERINAITSIHVIEGKPSASADLIAALVRRAGHRLRVVGDDATATAMLVRADDPEFTYEATWTLDRARAAGLAGKGVWKSYPAAMLRSRAITEVVRMGASDALLGVVYTPEELGAEVTADGSPVKASPPVASSSKDALRARLGTAKPTPPEPAEPEPSRDLRDRYPSINTPLDEPGVTPAQLKKIAAAMGELGLRDRDDALAYVTAVTDRAITSRNDLTKDEAHAVIERLEADIRELPVAAPDPADYAWPDTEAVES